MCSLAYHNCPACGTEYTCNQSDVECPIANHIEDVPCEQCQYWEEELQREDEQKRYRRMMWEQYGDE